MSGRVQGKVAIVVGAGQTPGASVGNGRATALLLAQHGAHVLAADRDRVSAHETAEQIRAAGGDAEAVHVDVTDEAAIGEMVKTAIRRWGRIDILHNNVGVGVVAGDAPLETITAQGFANVIAINLQGMVLTCKHTVPVMQQQRSGVITNIASNAALIEYPYVAYQTSKAGVVKLTEHLAIRYARDGVRANVILPGLMNTPMAVEHKIDVGGASREGVMAERAARVPLDGRVGGAWDVAHAALFLSSEEAGFITGTSLVVDGGQSLRVG